MNDKLARVRWEMGQTLLPEHFQVQEDSILTDTVMRFRLQGLPSYGIGSLELNETLLAEGIFSIQKMTLVTGSGLLLDVPGNTEVAPFNMNVPGEITLPVYLHVLKDLPNMNNDSDAWGEDTGEDIARVVCQTVISSDQNCSGAVETVKLVEFRKDPEGSWHLSENFIPPLLQLGTSLFLKKEMDELSKVLDLFQYNLSMESAGNLSGDSLISVRQCLKNVYKVQRLLANLKSQVHFHPYILYEELYTLYAEVCFYRNTNTENITAPYEHEKLVGLKNIIELLIKQMQLVRTRPPYLPFELKDNIYQVKLPKGIRKAVDAYFLIQKAYVTATFPIDKLKLSGLSRLPFVHKMALQGIPLKKVDRPPFQHSFGSEVEFYLIKEGEEWDNALNEMSAAFFSWPEIKETNFFIYWRTG